MKALGAGGALAVLGGTAAAQSNEQDDTGDEAVEDDTEAVDREENTVHTVRTLIGPSTNPQRPADFFYAPTGIHVQPGDVLKFVFETPDHNVTSYHPAYGMRRRIPVGVRPFSSPILGWDPDSLPDDVTDPPTEEAGVNGPPEDVNGPPGDVDGPPGDVNGPPEDVDGPPDDRNDERPRPNTWLYAFEKPGVYDLECAPHEAFGMAMRVVVGDETETDFETSDPSELPPPRAGPVGLAREVLTDPSLEPDNVVAEGRIEWMDLEANQEDEPEETPEDDDHEVD